MNEAEANKIGSKLGLISSGIGLLIAYTFMTVVFAADQENQDGLLWFLNSPIRLNIGIGALLLLLSGFFYGRITAKAILIKKRNFVISGFLCGMAVLITTTFLTGWVGFFQEGSNPMFPDDNPFVDFVVKPLWWVTIFGTIPALLVGIVFGAVVKSRGDKKQ